MMAPKRRTRRRIAYFTMAYIGMILIRAMIPWELSDNATSVINIMGPSLVGLMLGFIGGEAVSDHSARKHKAET